MEVEWKGAEGKDHGSIHTSSPIHTSPIHTSSTYISQSFWTHHQVGCVSGCTANHFATIPMKKACRTPGPVSVTWVHWVLSSMLHNDIDPFALILVDLHPGPWFDSSNHLHAPETQRIHIYLHLDSARDHSGSYNRVIVETE
jgi:hypothetical protein